MSADSGFDPRSVTGLILAGGRASRMGGIDKGLQHFQGRPLIEHALQRLGPQVGAAMINANRNRPTYEALGVPVWPDALPDFAGPLAGFLVGLERCTTPYLVTTPCDSPLFPLDLVARLGAALVREDAELAMVLAAEGDGPLRAQPVFSLMRVDLLGSLVQFTQSGGRKIDAWTSQHRTALVPFNTATDDPRAFANANTLDELRRLEN